MIERYVAGWKRFIQRLPSARPESSSAERQLGDPEKKKVIKANVDTLYHGLVENLGQADTSGVINGERRIGQRGQIIEAIKVYYRRFNGMIEYPHDRWQVGDYRVLKLKVVFTNYDLKLNKRKKRWEVNQALKPTYQILLEREEGELSPHDLARAFHESTITEDEEGNISIEISHTPSPRWIQPESLDPFEDWHLFGGEPVRRDHFTEGDLRLYQSLHEFNRLFSTPAEVDKPRFSWDNIANLFKGLKR